MKHIQSLSTYTFLVGVAVLFAALFIGYLVPVRSVPSAPPGLGPTDISVMVQNWRADRAQYDPTYIDRIQEISVPVTVSSKTVADWQAVRKQYQPGYMTEINKTPAKKLSSGCGRDGH
jgi:hypothetical protein